MQDKPQNEEEISKSHKCGILRDRQGEYLVTHRPEPWGAIHYHFETDEFVAEVAPGHTPRPSAPIGVGWVITGGCNKICIHCYGNAENLPADVLSTSECLAIADRLVEGKVMRITISGGEPMLRADLFEIIDHLGGAAVSVILGTNGSRIDASNVIQLRACTRVEISLDGSTREINNWVRPSRNVHGDSWAETIRAISLCLEKGIFVRVLTAVNSVNQKDLLAIARLLHKIGVSEWGVSWTVPAGRAFAVYDQLQPQASIIDEQLRLARQEFPQLNIKYSNRPRFNKFYCLVLPDGRVGTEDTLTGRKVYFGSLLRMPLMEFWDEGHYNLDQHFEKWIGKKVLPLRAMEASPRREAVVFNSSHLNSRNDTLVGR